MRWPMSHAVVFMVFTYHQCAVLFGVGTPLQRQNYRFRGVDSALKCLWSLIVGD